MSKAPEGWIIVDCDMGRPVYTHEFYHDDYDGAPDGNNHLAGIATSYEDALEQIEEIEAEL